MNNTVRQGRVELRHLEVDLIEFLLTDVSLEIAAGEYFVILGPTGAGKTVLLEAIAGLHRPSNGQILIDGEEVVHTPPEYRGIGFVYQDYVLFPNLTVAGNIEFGLHVRGVPREQREQRVRELAEWFGIVHLLDRQVSTLSGGESQRIALARALAVEPRLLLLDEPLGALDPETRERLQAELIRIHQEWGITFVHVTHDFEEAIALADRTCILNEGGIVQIGTAEDVFSHPANEFVARFVRTRNVFDVELTPGANGHKEIQIGGHPFQIDSDLQGTGHAAIRPEDILIWRESGALPASQQTGNGLEVVHGSISEILDKGAVAFVKVDVPPVFTCMVTARQKRDMALCVGERVSVGFPASVIHVFA